MRPGDIRDSAPSPPATNARSEPPHVCNRTVPDQRGSDRPRSAALAAGASEVLMSDSHGLGLNLLPVRLQRYT